MRSIIKLWSCRAFSSLVRRRRSRVGLTRGLAGAFVCAA